MKKISVSALLLVGLLLVARADDAPPAPVVRPWWEALGHPGLSAAVEQGLAAHPDSRSALASIRAAEAGVALAESRSRPEASLDAGYRWGREQSLVTGGVEDDIDPLVAGARMAWELDLFGGSKAGVDSAEARAALAQADWVSIRLHLSLAIARVYIDTALSTEQIEWYRRDAEDLRLLYERAERRTAAGVESHLTLDEALADWQQAEHRLMIAETERDRRVARLQQLVGGAALTNLPDDVTAFVLPPRPEHLEKDRVLGRPDVVRAYYGWLAAKGEATRRQRDRLPSLSLVLSAAQEGDNVGDPARWSAWAGPVLSIPAWSPEKKAVARQARAHEAGAEARLQEVSLRAVEDIDRAWAERVRADDMIEHMQKRRAGLESVMQVKTRKRDAGLIQENEWRRARVRAGEAARTDLRWTAAGLQAHVQLIAALGG